MNEWRSIKLSKPRYNHSYIVTDGERNITIAEYEYDVFIKTDGNNRERISFEVKYFMEIPCLPRIEIDEYEKNFEMALKFTRIKENLESLSDLINSNELTKANFKIGRLYNAVENVLDTNFN